MRHGPTRRTILTGLAAAALPLARRTKAAAPTGINLLTNWYAQAEHGGFYQARETGLYRKAGVDVQVTMGGPQVNNMQILLAGHCDVILGGAEEAMIAAARGMPVISIATSFQKSLTGLMTHPQIKDVSELKGHPILVSTEGRSTYWPWMKAKYGFVDEQASPYTFNLQPFLLNPELATQALATAEPYGLIQKKVPFNYFLLSDCGLPAYGNVLVTTRSVIEQKKDALAGFLAASSQGWVDYLFGDPAPANKIILADGNSITPGQLDWSRTRLREIQALGKPGERACSLGTRMLTDIHDNLVHTGLLAAGTNWTEAFTLEFTAQMNGIIPA